MSEATDRESYAEPWHGRGEVVVARVVGLVSRLIFWLAALFIVGNAVAQFAHDESWLLVVLGAAYCPVTLLIYPFVHHAAAVSLWPAHDLGLIVHSGPVPDATKTLIMYFAVAAVALVISTTARRMDRVE